MESRYILGRPFEVDHVTDYKSPKEPSKADKELTRLQMKGSALVLTTPQVKEKKICRCCLCIQVKIVMRRSYLTLLLNYVTYQIRQPT